MYPPIQTIPELFNEAVKHQLPDALAYKTLSGYQGISHHQYQESVDTVALALQALGLKKGDHVAIVSENCPEWAITDFACAFIGCPTVVLYPTLVTNQAVFILKHSESKWAFCSDLDQLNKIFDDPSQLPDLQGVVLFEGNVPSNPPIPVMAWNDLLSLGRKFWDQRPQVAVWGKNIAPEDLLTIIYTSGTTGDPKGAMLTHGNLASNISDSANCLDFRPSDRSLSFLPLNHIFERMVGHFLMTYIGVSIYYAESLSRMPDNLVEVKPTVLLSVPRIYEKIYTRTFFMANQGSLPIRLIFALSMKVASWSLPYKYRGLPLPFWLQVPYGFFKKAVYDKILDRMGGNLRLAASGGAALAPKILEFFWGIGLSIVEGYGLSETSPVISFNRPGSIKPGSVGKPLYDQWMGRPFVRLGDDGEILCQGPNIMQGYWKNTLATQEAIGDDGYFKTGDIGRFDSEGNLYITDRKKDLIITSGGKNVAPQPIENALKTDKYIAQAVLVGDGKNFIAALIVPNFDRLMPWAKRKRINFKDKKDLIGNPEVNKKIMKRIMNVNKNFSSYEHVKKICLLEDEMTQERGELTPTLKVKRRVVNEMYEKQINDLYS